MKNHTDLEQSKKLAEILPLESADMHSEAIEIDGDMVFVVVCGLGDKNKSNYGSPVWSLAALLNILNSIDGWYPGIDAQVDDENLWQICMFSYETGSDISTAALNKELVDTCYEVILKLKEKKIF